MRVSIAIMLLSTAAALPAQGRPQTPPKPRPAHVRSEKPPAAPQVRRPSEATFDLSFPGGTLADFVAALRKEVEGVNIVYRPLQWPVPVPAVTLKRVTVSTALDTVARLLEGVPIGPRIHNSEDLLKPRGAGPQPGLVVRMVKVREIRGRPSRTVFLVTVDPRLQLASQHPRVRYTKSGASSTRFQVFSLRGLLGRRGASGKPLTAEAVFTAIETALELGGAESQPPKFKLHPDTGLLFVRGTPAQVAIVQQVVASLKEDWREGAAAARAAERPTGAARAPARPAQRSVPPGTGGARRR